MAIPKKTIFKYDISQKYTIPTGVAGRYIGGKPTWTVTHSSGIQMLVWIVRLII